MEERIINPSDGVYAATQDYVHAIEVTHASRFVFVSGTMGLEASGNAPVTLEEQLKLVWSNIRRILMEADMSTDNIVRVTSYLRDADYATDNQNARTVALGNRKIPTTAIVVETLTPDWMIEIEVIAAA
ncbi:MAG TPA: RidA family protein [Woeseiaceae bacterium]|nr:RidA family protein [Woeseiaceae bacterium]